MVSRFWAGDPDLPGGVVSYCDNGYCGHQESDHNGDRGNCTAEVTDLYGTWQCMCVGWVVDPDA